MRHKITIAYDGAPYKGWQFQPDVVSVQEKLEQGLSAIAKAPIKIHGSGRTDTGVHAYGQVAHFDAPVGSRMTPENWLKAVNTRLPASIRLVDCELVTEDFHARFSAKSKTYEYVIETASIALPHDDNRVWHVPRGLDPAILEECLSDYVGEHDFRHFSALRGNETEESSFVRTLTQASVKQEGSKLYLRYSANGFLYKMVRILTGVVVSTACGRMEKATFQKMLTELDGDYNTAKLCAPAAGLTLVEVEY